MCSKNDSGATYCSELEELIKATVVAPKNSSTSAPLRRSQRLSQKLKKTTGLSESSLFIKHKKLNNITNVDKSIAKSSILTQEIFTTQDLTEPSEIFNKNHIIRHYDISLKEISRYSPEGCNGKKLASDVPLDLSKKFKELTGKTSQKEDKIKNVKGSLRPKRVKCGNQSRPEKNSSGQKSMPSILTYQKQSHVKQNFKKKPIKPLNFPNGTNSLKKIRSYKRTHEGYPPSIANSSLVSGKRKNLSIENIDNSNAKENAINNTKKKRLHRNVSRSKISKRGFMNSNPNLLKDSVYTTHISSDNTITYAKLNKRIQSLNESSDVISNKRLRLCTGNITKNEFSNKTKLSKKGTISELEASKMALKTKVEEVTSSNINESYSEEKMCLSKRICQSNKLQHTALNIIDESITDSETIKIAEIASTTKSAKNKLKNNFLQMKRKTSGAEIATNPKSAATSIVKNNLLCQGYHSDNKLEIDRKMVKTEILSQNSIKKMDSQNSGVSNKTKELLVKNIFRDIPNNNEIKNVSAESQLKLNDVQEIKLGEKTNPSKTDIESKNYIKSFNKNYFLDKIQNFKSFMAKPSTECNKLKIVGIPPTPDESFSDCIKKPILPDVYPPHFKNQLKPEEDLCLNVQPFPTCVITPDDTISTELLESSSSSPSLPESLCELFQTKDIKDILNVKRTSYRLNNNHIQALALILNLRLEYLRNILDKIMNISPDVLKNIDKALKMPFIPDCDIFTTSPTELWSSSEIVLNSQSPKHRKRRQYPTQRNIYNW